MKNAKKILLFLGAISLVAFGSFNMTGNKSNKKKLIKRKIKKLMQWQWQWKITDRHKIHRKLSR